MVRSKIGSARLLGRTLLALAIVATPVLAQPALAQDALGRSEWGSVTTMEAGWAEDTMAVYHSAPIVNPGGCEVTTAGYATNPNDPGHSLFHTLILSAFLNRKEVNFLVQGCVYGKPRIISVSMR